MAEFSPRCAGCSQQLGPDDQYCPKCGMPMAVKVDPNATIVDSAGYDDLESPGSNVEVTAPVEVPESKGLPEGANFNVRLRHILGAEYEVLSMIGKGGFAQVYKARDRRLDRIVAIKVIRPELIGKKLFVESFRNEGIALAKLRHPGIIPIYDIREREGLIYYIMPFVQGADLEARLGRGKIPPYESRRILCELADALEAAHRLKMAHLDIKPDNVFLEGDLQKVLVMDFGIATAISEQIPDASDGPVVGTPAYMSPEQAQGLPEIDHRSDIYSIGALGYRMLMGRPPFTGRDANEVLEKHVKEAPVHIRDINPTIPKDFADAIMRCLEKDPWDRFPTAKKLEAALEAVEFASTRTSTRASARVSTRGDAAPGEASVGLETTTIAVIVLVALIIGVLIGIAIG